MLNTDFDKVLELEECYKREQLAAFNWEVVDKAPMATGEGFFYETSKEVPYPYRQQFESEVQRRGEWLSAQSQSAMLARLVPQAVRVGTWQPPTRRPSVCPMGAHGSAAPRA